MKRPLAFVTLLGATLFSCASVTSSVESSISSSSSSSLSSDSSGNSSLSSPSSGSSSSSSSVAEELDAQTTFRLLSRVAKASSYRFEYPYQGSIYDDYVSTDYYFNALGNTGYIPIESYDKALGERIVYLFYLDSKDEFRLAYPYESGGAILNDVSSFNMLSSLKSVLQRQNFFAEGDEIYSTNEKIIYALAMQLGYQQDAMDKTFNRVRFYLDGNDLAFCLQIYDTNSGTSVDIDDCNAVFRDVGSAVLPQAENFLATFPFLPQEVLPEDALGGFDLEGGKTVSIVSTMDLIYADGEEVHVGDTLSSRREGEIYLEVESDGEKSQNVYFDDEGFTAERGLNAANEVDRMRLGEYYLYDEMFPEPLTLLLEEREAFRFYDGSYRYFGFEADTINENLSAMGAYGSVESLTIDLDENGEFSALNVVYPEMVDMATGRAYFVVIHSELAPEQEFVDVVPASSLDKEAEAALKKAFAVFDGSTPFTLLSHEERTEGNELNIYYDGEALVYEDKSLRLSGDVYSEYEGYYLEDGLLQRFIKPHGEEATRNGARTEEEISSRFRFDLSPLLFRKEEDNWYSVKPYVLNTIKDHMILGRNGRDLVALSLRIHINEEGLIDQMVYDTDDGLLTTGTDIVEIKYGDVTLPNNLKEELSSLPSWVEPTTWEEDSPDVYEDFVSFYGQEAADTIPYLYHPETYRKWSSTYIFTVDVNNSTQSECDDEWYASYKELLVESGYALDPEPDLPGAEIYRKGIVEMRLAKVLRGGIYFDIAEG